MEEKAGECCTHEHCFVPETPCQLGEQHFKQCKNFQGTPLAEKKAEKNEKTPATDDAGLLPWSGNVLGSVDLQFVAARSRPKVIGVVGPHNAGKSTWLGMLYLLLARGRTLKDRSFAGSYTFGGWENLAHWLRWPPGGGGPGFPPHTPSNTERSPGLLHLAFRNQNDALEDVLFTDAPGEWFESWTINKDDPNAAGVRWIMRHADAVILFVDSEALAGAKKGQARQFNKMLAQRLRDQLGKRPLAVVWAKSDIAIPDAIRSTLEKTFRECFPRCLEFSVTVKPADGWNEANEAVFTDPLRKLIASHGTLSTGIPRLPVRRPMEPFFAFRGK